mgnify:CR=1 FL=1
MTQKVLILEGHPEKNSFCYALSKSASEGARLSGATVRHHQLSELDFDLGLKGAYKTDHPLEPDLQALWQDLCWCDRLILVHPLWWGAAPSKLKGLFDRILLPGEAFHYEEGKALPIGHFKGKTAEALITSDTPSWYLRLVYRAGWHIILKKQIFEFCGFKVRHIRNLGPIRQSTPEKREKFLKIAHQVGLAA